MPQGSSHPRIAKDVSDALGYIDMVQNNPHHFGTINEHIDAVIDAVPKTASTEVQIAAIFHDIGKFSTRSVNAKTGYDSFVGHAERSAKILGENRERFLNCFSEIQQNHIIDLVRLHDTKYSRQAKCEAMLNGHENGFAKDLLVLQYADVLGQSLYKREDKLREIADFGNLIKSSGLPEQTRGIGEVLDLVREAILNTVAEETYKLEQEARQKKYDSGYEEKEFFARTKDNKDIYIGKRTQEHLLAHPDVKISHIREAIGTMTAGNRSFIKETSDLGRTIGKNICVSVTKDDQVSKVFRTGRNIRTAYVRGREPEDTSLLSSIIAQDRDGRMTLVTGFYGPQAPREIEDPKITPEEREESVKFWTTHALVLPNEAIDWDKTNRENNRIAVDEQSEEINVDDMELS